MKKVRVDFSAHVSVVVAVKDGDDYWDRAIELAETRINGASYITRDAYWEVDDDGVDDADETDEIDFKEEM